jgi:hypothetical protein
VIEVAAAVNSRVADQLHSIMHLHLVTYITSWYTCDTTSKYKNPMPREELINHSATAGAMIRKTGEPLTFFRGK